MSDLSILHLSDLHFSAPADSNWFAKHKDAFIDAVCRGLIGSSNVLVIFSGDLANTGKQAEYDYVKLLLESLTAEIARRGICEDIDFICCPGNHDQNFELSDEARSVLVDLDEDKLSPQLVDVITATQNEYFDFVASIEGAGTRVQGDERLSRVRRIEYCGHSFTFNILNTAWTSKIREDYGSLRWLGRLSIANDGDHVFTVLHHPTSWMKQETGLVLRNLIESRSDFIITGHEHSQAISSRDYASGKTHVILEAGPLQERSVVGRSQFHILRFNLGNHTYVPQTFTLNGLTYSREASSPREILLNRARTRKRPRLQESFLAKIQDPGHGLNHPRRPELKLTDFYVVPSLMRAGDQSREERLIKPKSVLDRLTSRHSIIVGPEVSGKSSLGYMFFHELWERGSVPLFVNADDLQRRHLTSENDLVHDALSRNYHPDEKFDYWEIPYSERVLIVDDLHRFKFSPGDLQAFLEEQKARFSTVVALSGVSYVIRELFDTDQGGAAAAGFEHLQLLDFGYVQRDDLVRKWCSIGLSPGELGCPEFGKVVDRVTAYLNDAIRKNFVPPLPSYIVLMLQAIDASKALDPNMGSFGQLYQSVINKHLYADDQSLDTDTKANFLAAFASWIASSPKRDISRQELEEKYSLLVEEYDLSVTWSEMWSAISRTRLLGVEVDRVSFRYDFVFSHFYSLHIVQQLDEDARIGAIRKLVDSAHLDESASTLLCVIQQTKDPRVVQIVLDRARQIFSDREVIADLDRATAFMNQLVVDPPRRVLVDGDARDTRREQLEAQDAALADQSDDDLAAGDIEPRQESVMAVMNELAAGYRIMQVIGQILRAFSGSLKADQKAALCNECFNIGLRIFALMISATKEEGVDLIEKVAEHLKKDNQSQGDAVLAQIASRQVFFMVEMFGFNLIKHLSRAVGTSRLEKTLQRVFENKDSSHKLIEMVIQLDHYPAFPAGLVESVASSMESRYTASLVRDFVWVHMHMVETPREVRQRVCERLGIKLVPRMLYDKEIKKLPAATNSGVPTQIAAAENRRKSKLRASQARSRRRNRRK